VDPPSDMTLSFLYSGEKTRALLPPTVVGLHQVGALPGLAIS